MTERSNEAARCLAQADLLLLIARMLESPVTWSAEERKLADEDIEALADTSGLARQTRGAEVLRSAVAEWSRVESSAAVVEYARLFDGTLACPCNETVYIRRDKGVLLADIAGFYRAFGFELSEQFREKHDHVVVELQFTALLLVLLGRALDSGATEQHEVAKGALEGFLSDHLGSWIVTFAGRLESVSDEPFFRSVARLVRAAWDTITKSHDLSDGGDPEVSFTEDVSTPYECGLCDPVKQP